MLGLLWSIFGFPLKHLSSQDVVFVFGTFSCWELEDLSEHVAEYGISSSQIYDMITACLYTVHYCSLMDTHYIYTTEMMCTQPSV